MGIPVLSRKEAVERYPDAVFIITSMVYDLQIKNELELLGAKNIFDFVCSQLNGVGIIRSKKM